MVLLNIIILLGSYAGYRLLETVQSDDEGDTPLDRSADAGVAGVALDQEYQDKDDVPRENETRAHVSTPVHAQGVGAGVAAMGLSATRALGLGLPFAAPVSLVLTVWATLPMLRRAEDSLRQHKVNNDVLSSTASLLTLGLGQLFAAGLQAGAYHLGQLLALRAKDAAEASVLDLSAQPTMVWRRINGLVVSFALERLELGDIVVVSAGDTIPVDGTIVDGHASIDERILTGESAPAEKEVGDEVLASAIVLSGTIDIEVEHSGAETAAARMAALLEQAGEFKSDLQLQGERWSDGMAAPVLVASAISAPLIGVPSAVALLFAAPSNAIRATGALQTASHLTAISRQGILVRDGRGFEALAGVDTVLFDKTGTLTEDAFDFEVLRSRGALSESRLLGLAAALEQRMSHPIAAAIVTEARGRGIELPPVEGLAVVLGGGVHGHIEGKELHLGSLRFLAHQGITADEDWAAEFVALDEVACTNVFLAADGRLEGAIALKPRVRPEAEHVIEQLRALGMKHIGIVSGDAPAPTRAVAESLHLDGWHAETLPEEKAALVARLQAQGRSVCFIGDGINDALAMRQADASVTLVGASALATQTAQLLLVDGSLRELPEAFVRSRELLRGLTVTLGVWATYAVGAMVGAAVLRAGVLATTIAYGTMLSACGLYSAWPALLPRKRS